MLRSALAKAPSRWQFGFFRSAAGLLLFGYALYIKDPVFILGQGFGVFVYLRNLYFIKCEQRAGAAGA